MIKAFEKVYEFFTGPIIKEEDKQKTVSFLDDYVDYYQKKYDLEKEKVRKKQEHPFTYGSPEELEIYFNQCIEYGTFEVNSPELKEHARNLYAANFNAEQTKKFIRRNTEENFKLPIAVRDRIKRCAEKYSQKHDSKYWVSL